MTMELPLRLCLVMVFVVKLLALAVFLNGFFPVKHSMSGFATKPTQTEPTILHEANSAAEGVPHAYDRLVLVLIDALRADFVLPGGTSSLPQMEFVKSLIQRNETHSYMARAHPPTVTMPRIKALTTGGIPGFIDVVMNFDSQSVEEDNLVSQLYRHGRKLVFYGDDTWMRLFPEHFIRTDGTTSFFVADYIEVDHNVTRHLVKDLKEHDWDVLILHYLGLDHIGHLAGPFSPLIKPKLQEMDSIVKQIYDALAAEPADRQSLLVLCGDHGMSDQGSHGGSSLSETSTPLLFIDPKWIGGKGRAYQGDTVEQIDIAPTLALSLGIPIPQNNLGAVIVNMLSDLSHRDRLRATYTNAQQLLKVLQQNIDDFEKEPSYLQLQRANKSHMAWIQMYESDPDSPALEQLSHRIIDQYRTAIVGMREKLSGMLLHYDLHAMAVSILVLWVVLAALFLQLATGGSTIQLLMRSTLFISAFIGAVMVFAHVSICTSEVASDFLCAPEGSMLVLIFILFTIAVASSLLMQNQIKDEVSLILKRLHSGDAPHVLLVWGTLVHTLSFLSTSFVEEEHQTWYFLTVSVHLLLAWRLCTGWYRDTHDMPGGSITSQYPRRELQSENISDMNACSAGRLQGGEVYQRRPSYRTHAETISIQSTSHKTGTQREWSIVLSGITLLILCRVCRSWNQTGDKWTHLPDVGDWLSSPENICVLSVLVFISLVLTSLQVCISSMSITNIILFIFGSVGVYCFRAANGALLGFNFYDVITKGIPEARFVYNMMLLMMINTFYSHLNSQKQSDINSVVMDEQITINSLSTEPTISHGNGDISNGVSEHAENNHPSILTQSVSPVIISFRNMCCDIQSCWILFMMLVVRPHNIILVMLVVWQEYQVRYISRRTNLLGTTQMTLLYYWMGQMAFFYQGNSNSISTVDVSAGYIGLENYQPIIIGLLMCLSSYAMPIYWLVSLLRVLCDMAINQVWKVSRFKQTLLDVMTVLGLCRALPLAMYTVLVTSQRYHLFVWTVFSPKLLYEGMLTVVVTGFVMILAVVETLL